MVRPANFGYNAQTAESNAFQQLDNADPEVIRATAMKEFDGFVALLRAAGVHVVVAQDDAAVVKPDAVFPNNWFTTHSDLDRGALMLYPMYAPSRRVERDMHIVDQLRTQFQISRVFDFSHNEAIDRYVEGTGSMIFDRVHGVVYACLSPRTDAVLMGHIAAQLDYELCLFTARDASGVLIYHTNVMMALGHDYCVICLDSIVDTSEKHMVIDSLQRTNKRVVNITIDQMNRFAGNMIEVLGTDRPLLVMSQTAFDSLTDAQRKDLSSSARLLAAPINTIETYGGGSARCMMAEIFLPTRPTT
jgi:hypothetical protein